MSMLKKLLIVIAPFLVFGLVTFGAAALASPDAVAVPEAITSTTPCPVVGCAQTDGACHAAKPAPVPDGSFEMSCPRVKGCSDIQCHAWDRIEATRYKPSDVSLNLWILAPVLLTIGLVLIVRKSR
jgi:hypothetical protein